MASKRPLQEDTKSTSTDQPQKKRKGFRVGPENLPDGAWRRKNTKIKEDLIHKAKLKKAYKKVKVEQEKEEAERAAARASAAAAAAGNNNETEDGDGGEQQASQVHPDRQILLEGGSVPPRRRQQQPRQNEDEGQQHAPNGDDNDNKNEDNITQRPQQSDSHSEPQDQQSHNHNTNNRKPRRPDYYSKALEQGARKKAEAEARLAEQQRRAAEREEKIAEREKVRKAMLKARGIKTGGGRAGDRDVGHGYGHGAARRSYNNKQGPHKLGRESHVLLDKIKRMVGK